MKPEKFKSIHIDLEKGIYELNGIQANRIRALALTWDCEDGWALEITRDEVYTAPA